MGATPRHPRLLDLQAGRGRVIKGCPMPTYEYKCKKCGKKFELVMSMSEHESKRAACPKCKSRTLERVYSGFFAKTSRKS